jgi:hypothetical protein
LAQAQERGWFFESKVIELIPTLLSQRHMRKSAAHHLRPFPFPANIIGLQFKPQPNLSTPS